MSNNEEKNVKEIKKDYGAVKEKEHKSKASMKKNKKAFDSKTKITDNEYQKAIDSLDQELDKIKEVFVQKQETQKKLYTQKTTLIQKQIKELTTDHEAAVKAINDAYLKRKSAIKKEANAIESDKSENLSNEDKSMVEQETLFERSLEDINKTHLDSVEKHEAQKEAVKTDFEGQLDDVKNKKEHHIQELEEENAKKIQEFEQSIKIEKSATEEKLEIINEKHEEQASLINEKKKKVNAEFEKQIKALDESIEHKTARHEKFMEKSEKDHDERAVKLHKNEIKNLHKVYDRDLHDLQKNKQSQLNALDKELDELNKHFSEEKIMLERGCKKEVEEIIYKTELLNAEENYLAEKFRLTIDVDIMDVSYKYEEAKVELESNELVLNENKEGSLAKHHADKDIIAAKYDQNKQLILREYDIREATNECANELALIDKEAEISKLNLDLSIDEASAEFDLETEKHRRSLEKEILCYEEQIAHYENDFERQKALKNEYVSYQTMVKSLEQDQLREIAEYDEEETKNRYQLKISYMESLLPMIDQDKEMLLNKIDKQFSLETSMYDEQIELISASRLEEMEEIKKEFDQKVAKIIEKRDQLDPNGYKREIKEYNSEIKELNHLKDKMVSRKKHELEDKTALYKSTKKNAEERKHNALDEARAFFDKEVDHIKRTIQLLKEELDKELYNKDTYLQKMKDDALHYETFTSELANLMDEENNTYLQGRIEKAEEQIQELRDLFEEELKERKAKLTEKTDKFEALKKEVVNRLEEETEKVESDKDQKIAVISEQAKKTEARFEQFKKERLAKYESKIKDLHHTVKQKILSLKQDLAAEQGRLKKKQSEIEKEVKKLNKQYSKTKKLIYKKYQASLKKELDTIARKRVS